MKARILIVEDERGLVVTLRDRLTREGYGSETTGDPGEALRLAKERVFDVILLDLMLPGGNGLDVMITVQKAGTATIVASTGTLCGTSTLTATATTADHWTIGSARYTSGQVLTLGMLGGGGPPGQGGDDATRDVACTSCHGDTPHQHRDQPVRTTWPGRGERHRANLDCYVAYPLGAIRACPGDGRIDPATLIEDCLR